MGQSFSALCMDGVILFTGGLSLNLFFFFCFVDVQCMQNGVPLNGFALCFCKIVHIPLTLRCAKK
jgi:hypothetical protein